MNVNLTWLDYQKEVFFDFQPGVKYKIIPKGRRAGFTRGGANACIKDLIKGDGPWLWGDTINGNIQRYYERYFWPVLHENKIPHKFDSVHKKLQIGRQFCDFRSADNPENWEGFAYKKIFLNEAGIILKDRSLYINSVLPMMIDFPDSQLIAAGVPKGKVLKDGSEHPFYTLAKRADDNPAKYFKRTFTSYDNPLLNPQDIRDLEDDIAMLGPEQIRQEIYGEFIEMDAINPFAHQWRPVETKEHYAHQDKRAVFDAKKQIVIHMDFNLNPMAIIFSHIWQDGRGIHDHQFDEMEIKNASIPLAIARIREKYGQWIQGAVIGGDYMGMRGSLEHRENWSFFKQIISGLNMSESQLKLVPNPTHVQSRNDVNYVLLKHLDFIVNPDTCPNTCRDMRNVQCDAYGQILKKDRKDVNQRGDFLDCFVGETKIKTFGWGSRRIDDLKIGDMVLTRNGRKKIIDTWSSVAEVYEFEFSDGTKIQCTKDHKFLAYNVGWCEIKSIFEKKLQVCKYSQTNQETNSLTTMGEDTSATQSKNIFTLKEREKITRALCIDKCGLINMAKLKRDLMFITRTTIPLTTRFPISNLKRKVNTLANTCVKGFRKIQKYFLRGWITPDYQQANGMVVLKESNGINFMQKISDSGSVLLVKENVTTVKKDFSQNQDTQGFVPQVVSQDGGINLIPAHKKGSALYAQQSLKQENMRQEYSVQKNANQLNPDPVSVKSMRHIGKRRVYDITVEGEHEFFANEILVHNCVRAKIAAYYRNFIDKKM